MTALLTDEEIRQFVIVFARDWKTRTGKNSRHVRIEFAVAAAAHVLSAQEARLAEDAKVRAGLVEALEAVKASWTNNDPLRAQHILQINDALASAKLLA